MASKVVGFHKFSTLKIYGKSGVEFCKNRQDVFDTRVISWFHGVMVSTPDSESGDPSSSLGGT